MALLADDVTGRLIAALRKRPCTAPQIERETGASQKTIAHALELLQAHGIVNWQKAPARTPGRPSRIWLLANDKELAAFEWVCDEFKALMLREQLSAYNEASTDVEQRQSE